ncbi:hypothetical protein ACFLUZ_01260 [Chloroflexota bacterium]
MQLLGLFLGIFSIIGMFIFFIPLLGALNWLNIPLAITGLIISLIAIANAQGSKKAGITGIILCSIAIIVGVIRLNLGCGII